MFSRFTLDNTIQSEIMSAVSIDGRSAERACPACGRRADRLLSHAGLLAHLPATHAPDPVRYGMHAL